MTLVKGVKLQKKSCVYLSRVTLRNIDEALNFACLNMKIEGFDISAKLKNNVKKMIISGEKTDVSVRKILEAYSVVC